MEGEIKNETGERPGDAEFEYLVRVGMQPNFASIEVIPPLREKHENILINELGEDEAPEFVRDEGKSVLWMEPSEPLSSQIHGFDTQEAEVTELAEKEAIARGKEIGEVLASIAGVEVTYGPRISAAEREKEQELLAA